MMAGLTRSASVRVAEIRNPAIEPDGIDASLTCSDRLPPVRLAVMHNTPKMLVSSVPPSRYA